jgi:cytochrome c oxidase subunit 2
MQMKIVVDTPEEYKKWLQSKPTFAEEIKAEKTTPATTDPNAKGKDSTMTASSKVIAQVVKK